MANRRMINKVDSESPLYLQLSIRQRYLYHMLMLYADDDGIIPLIMIKAKCFPGDDINQTLIYDDLGQLERHGFIQRYASNDYLVICDWWTKQFIDKKIYTPSTHPKPPGYEIRPESLTKHSHKPYYKSKRVSTLEEF